MTETLQTRIHFSVEACMAHLSVDTRMVSKSWKKTANQTPKERHILVPFECVTAPEVPDQFRPLVESALMSAAETVLRDHVNAEGDQCNTIPLALFSRPSLIETFMGREAWMTREQLEVAFTGSTTWKRIASRPEYQANASYRKMAEYFKGQILKLAGKRVDIPAAECDVLMTKISDSDLETEFGSFVLRRLDAIKNRKDEVLDLSAL